MKSKEVLYKYGHFYDAKTHERIVVEDGTVLTLVLPDENVILGEDPDNRKLSKQSYKTIIDNIGTTYRNLPPRKILSAGQLLTFFINGGYQKKNKDKYKFSAELIDDLYVFKRNPDQAEIMADCHCVVFKENTGRLNPFEPIYAKSLNNAYSKTYVHYFNKHGAGTANAFDKFMLPDGTFLKRYREPKNSNGYWSNY